MRRRAFLKSGSLWVPAIVALSRKSIGQRLFEPNLVLANPVATGGGGGGSVAYDNSQLTVTNSTATFVVGSGSNRLLLAAIWTYPSAYSSTPSYNSVNLTQVVGDISDGSGGDHIQLWKLINPASGSHSFSAGTTVNDIVLISFSGVHQTTSLGTAQTVQQTTGHATPITVNVSSASNEMVFDAATISNNCTRTMVAHTGRVQVANDGNDEYVVASYQPGIATTVCDWTISTNQQWAHIAIAVKPA
jgi:hypothetical protein